MVLIGGALMGCRPAEQDAATVQVFAAASLTDALSAVADSFEVVYPDARVSVNVAATSLLARQIEQGAPADVFFSANRSWMDYLHERALIEEPIREPLGNRLVVVGPPGTPPLREPADLTRFERIALADPAHVPAGLYAREALACAGLWETLEPVVIPALDVRAALLSVRAGAAEAGIVYASDARVDTVLHVILEWPEPCRPEVRYTAAVLRDAPHPDWAYRFLDYAVRPARAPVWEGFGFQFRMPHATFRNQ